MPKTISSNIDIGRKGEDAAVMYLIQRGFKLIGRNIRTEYGEIDIVAENNGNLVFVEVKARRSRKYGFPEEAINSIKQDHMINSALAYIQEKCEVDVNWRIDVIAINLRPGGKHEIEWFKNAITC